MQLSDDAGLASPQLDAQQVGEQCVVAEPVPAGVERNDERVGLLEAVQDGLRSPPIGEHVGKRSVDPFEDRGAQQQPPHVIGLVLEHLGE